METFLIWSHEHGKWWGPDERGYVDDVADAGRYRKDHAAELTMYHVPAGEEVPVLETSALSHDRGAVWGIKDPRKAAP